MVSLLQKIVLPYAQIAWDIGIVTGGTFVRYNVLRRFAGETAYTRIATIADINTLTFRDYAITPRKVGQYYITQTVNISGELIDSLPSEVTEVVVNFNWAYLHSMLDPSQYVVFFTLDIGEDVQQEVQLRTAWGRSAPTAFIGEADYLNFHISGLPDIIRGTVWAVRDLASLQVTDAAVYCLRLGIEAERHFVNITNLSRRIGNLDYQPDMAVSEVFYEEAV